MAINLPGELSWVLNMLGFDWPEIDEDELRLAADYVRQFDEDLTSMLNKVEGSVTSDIATAFESKASSAVQEAWTENRTSNLNKLVELLDPAAIGMELIASTVEALKLKVIAELVITAAQIAAAVASSFVTFGLGAAANVALIAARKKAMTFAVNVIIEQVLLQVMDIFEDQIANGMSTLIGRILDSPVTQNVAGDPTSYQADVEALEQIASDMDSAGTDFERVSDDFTTKMSSLEIFTGV